MSTVYPFVPLINKIIKIMYTCINTHARNITRAHRVMSKEFQRLKVDRYTSKNRDQKGLKATVRKLARYVKFRNKAKAAWKPTWRRGENEHRPGDYDRARKTRFT